KCPIGVYLGNRNEFRPRARADGIVAEIAIERSSYDYRAIRKDGDFYSLSSLFEDSRNPKQIYFNTGIVRGSTSLSSEALCKLDVHSAKTIRLAIRYGGLRDR